MATKKDQGPLVPGMQCLSPKDLQTLNRLLQECADTACMLDGMEALGLDVSQLRAENGSQQQFATNAKAQQFPGAP